MKSGTRAQARLAALLLGVAMLPAYAAGGMSAGKSFKDLDADKDGYLSVDEFKAKGKDELAFKAADIDGDQRVDPGEFDKYRTRKATDPKSGPEAGGQPKPSGY